MKTGAERNGFLHMKTSGNQTPIENQKFTVN